MKVDFSKFPYDFIRDGQEDALKKVDKCDKKYIVIEAPTGIGKSAIAFTLGCSASSSYLICTNKSLQDQYVSDFLKYDESIIANLKGKSNYQCTHSVYGSDGRSCEDSLCKTKPMDMLNCREEGNCPYYNAKHAANNSNIFLTNSSVLTANGGGNAIMNDVRQLLIFDEAHLLESALLDAARIELNYEKLNNTFKFKLRKDIHDNLMNFKCITGDYEHNKSFINYIIENAQIAYNKEKEKCEEAQEPFNPSTFERSFIEKVNFYSSHEDEEWSYTWDDFTKTLIIEPLYVNWLFKSIVEPMATKFIFMSATILDFNEFCQSTGIPANQTEYIRLDSTFDPKKSPIYIMDCCSTDYKSLQNIQNMNNIAKECEKILEMDAFKNCKGIIHTGNMKISKHIKDYIGGRRLLVRYENTTNNMILEQHKKGKNTVLVSSSMTEGVSLNEDMSRFQIIVKLPWQSLASDRVKKLSQNGNWYSNEMWKKFIQASGRSTRSEDDQSVTFVFDDKFTYWYNKSKNTLPKYFTDRIIFLK